MLIGKTLVLKTNRKKCLVLDEKGGSVYVQIVGTKYFNWVRLYWFLGF